MTEQEFMDLVRKWVDSGGASFEGVDREGLITAEAFATAITVHKLLPRTHLRRDSTARNMQAVFQAKYPNDGVRELLISEAERRFGDLRKNPKHPVDIQRYLTPIADLAIEIGMDGGGFLGAAEVAFVLAIDTAKAKRAFYTAHKRDARDELELMAWEISPQGKAVLKGGK